MSPQSETLTKRGEVLISGNHLKLLHGLCHCPGGHAASYREWIEATLAFLARIGHPWPTQREVWGDPESALVYSPKRPFNKPITRLNPTWVRRGWNGSRISVTLTDRGRGIVEGSVPARVRGTRGPDGELVLATEYMRPRTGQAPPVEKR